jgi:hypothetical protein
MINYKLLYVKNRVWLTI